MNLSVQFYSRVETAKANGLEPYANLKHVFSAPKATCIEDIEALLPFKPRVKLEQAVQMQRIHCTPGQLD